MAPAPNIRSESPADPPAVRRVLELAFPTAAEADLVDRLRDVGRLAVSLVAVDGDQVVGHVAVSPVTVDGAHAGLGLAPVAVTPDRQRQGIGGGLVRAAIEAAAGLGEPLLVVLGEPAYYGRFGFEPASRLGLRDAYGGGEAFQAMTLPGSDEASHDASRSVLVEYAPEFAVFE